MSFLGHTVLVTAAASGAGRVIAERFAAAGAAVAVCDVDAAALATVPANIARHHADLSDPGAIERLFDAVLAASHGVLDVLVNNAGIAGSTARAEDGSLADWDHTIRVNLGSHFRCARRAIRVMRPRRRGAILNISSASAKVGPPMRLPYVVAKAAILSLTQTLARELGPDGVRVNAILPGAIEGERLHRVIAAKASALGAMPADLAAELFRFISLRRAVTADEVASAVLFLASDAACAITGQCIGVDGNVEWEA